MIRPLNETEVAEMCKRAGYEYKIEDGELRVFYNGHATCFRWPLGTWSVAMLRWRIVKNLGYCHPDRLAPPSNRSVNIVEAKREIAETS